MSRLAGDEVVRCRSPHGAAEDILTQRSTTRRRCVVVQTPDVFGHLRDLEPIAEKAHAAGALLIAVVTEVVSLGLVEPPGEMGADIVVGEGQSIGNALDVRRALCRPVRDARTKYVRQMPGRLAARRSMPKASAASC